MLGDLLSGNIFGFLGFAVGLLAAVSVHEAAHAAAADYLGDPTARLLGRKSLNPLRHLDPIGTLMLLLIGFGWGKPVPFDAFNLKEPRRDGALISLAGPASNLLLAGALGLALRLGGIGVIGEIRGIVISVIQLNVVLAVFNLLPIPPLDGFKIAAGLLPEGKAQAWLGLERYGLLILLFLLFLVPGFLNFTVVPVVNTLLTLLRP